MKSPESGTKKIKISDFKLYEKKRLFWKKIADINPTQGEILQLFAKNNNLALIMEEKIKDFIKGCIDNEGNISGSRIKHLPNGKKIARGGYSIFAKHLTYNTNEEFSWDICYQNSSGTKTYLYSEDKIHLEQKEKYNLVKKFQKNYNLILNKLEKDIKNSNEINNLVKYLGLYTLIKTYIRVGNYEYYKKFGHKGLTTLQKKDIRISSDGFIEFNFIGKDGIPQNIIKKFDLLYLKKLKKVLNKLKNNDFVFSNSIGNPLHSSVFSDILFEYTGIHFYPHIIRSFYADTTIENKIKELKRKLKNDKNFKISKKDIENIYLEIALNLGHKKFNKKKKIYEPSFKITLANYIYPDLIKKIENLINN